MKGKQMAGFPPRDQALKDFYQAWTTEELVELVPLAEAAGRICAVRLCSRQELPPYRVAACDGIAVSASSFEGGFPDTRGWRPGREYQRADTGDDFADCYDLVIPIEEVRFCPDGSLELSRDIPAKTGWNVRPAGDMLKRGELLLEEGLPIRPADLASLAMGGIAMVPVRRRPVAAFIPTGNELVPAGIRPGRGQNVDTNSVMAGQMLAEFGAEPLIFPIVPDEPEALREALSAALAAADLVIINGGSALGDEDFNFRLLGQGGKLIHHYIAAAPGRPMALAVMEGKPVINLPGPTMAAFFGLDWCVRAVVSRMLRLPVPRRQRVYCLLENGLRTNPHMAILCPMRVTKTPRGDYRAHYLSFFELSTPFCLAANGMYISEIGESMLEPGQRISVELLRGEEYAETEGENEGGEN